MRILNILGINIGLAFLVIGSAYGAIIHVPDDYSTIQEAHDAASDGDTVLVAPGTYRDDFMLRKTIAVKSD